MNFDTLCSIVLEGKKQQQFDNIIIANPSPVFTIEDVLKDPNDPSKGVKTYLDAKVMLDDAEGEIDHERQARRVLRRLNWVVKSLIKRTGSRSMNLRKLHIGIMVLIEKYLREVLGYTDEQIEIINLKVAKEAALIGNLLLPANTRYPNAKGVFDINVDTPGAAVLKKNRGTVADRIMKDFNMSVDEYIAAYDPDLIGTIKDIIRGSTNINKEGVEPNEEDDMVDPEIDATENATDDTSTLTPEHTHGIMVSDIVKDPRIKNIYDNRIVRRAIKSLLQIGSIVMDDKGYLTLQPEGEEGWRAIRSANKDIDSMEDIEDITTPNPEEASINTTEVEDEENIEDMGADTLAARRLGYDSSSNDSDEKWT